MDRSKEAWPSWVIQAIVKGNEASFMDAVWSVGGSPPYGGVSYEEASAIYQLLESYRGPGMVPERTYQAALAAVGDNRDRRLVIEAFRANDKITSFNSTYSIKDALAGLRVAEQLKSDPLRGLFFAYQAGALARNGDFEAAAVANRHALDAFLRLAAEDDSYADRVGQMANNQVSMLANAGHLQQARDMFDKLGSLMTPQDVELLGRALY